MLKNCLLGCAESKQTLFPTLIEYTCLQLDWIAAD